MKKAKSMNNAHYQISRQRKNPPELKKLPPTDANMMLHIRGSHLAETRDITTFGWEVTKEGAVMPAVPTKAVAPVNLLDAVALH